MAPERPEHAFNMGVIELEAGKLDRAEPFFKQALALKVRTYVGAAEPRLYREKPEGLMKPKLGYEQAINAMIRASKRVRT